MREGWVYPDATKAIGGRTTTGKARTHALCLYGLVHSTASRARLQSVDWHASGVGAGRAPCPLARGTCGMERSNTATGTHSKCAKYTAARAKATAQCKLLPLKSPNTPHRLTPLPSHATHGMQGAQWCMNATTPMSMLAARLQLQQHTRGRVKRIPKHHHHKHPSVYIVCGDIITPPTHHHHRVTS